MADQEDEPFEGRSAGARPCRTAEPGSPNGFDFLESSPFAQIAFTFDLEILAANAKHVAMTGLPAERIVGRQLFDAFPANPDAPDASAEAPLRASVERVHRTGLDDEMPVVKHDVESLQKPGTFEPRYWRLTHSPLRGTDGMVRGVLQTAVNVTDEAIHRGAEAARRRSAESAGRLMFWELDFAKDRIEYSPGIMDLFGFSPDEARRYANSLPPLADRIHEEDRPAVVANMVAARDAPIGATFSSDYRIVRPDGTVRHINASSEVVSSGEGRKQIGVMVDITVLHRREEALRRMVEEKQKLLDDVNHRVKNSLQLVTSLLHIEERAATGGAAEQLHRTAGRVAAIAAVHASLYHYADMSRVDVSEHLRTFCGQIADDHEGRLELDIEKEPLFLSAEKAVPLALLVNEIIADSLGNIGSSEGKVLVKLEYDGPRLLLHVKNAVKRADTKPGPIGTRLFQALLEQLDGTFTQDTTDGCNACLEFHRT